ncbi:hypothetical protein D1872_311920 [compost metagenome]
MVTLSNFCWLFLAPNLKWLSTNINTHKMMVNRTAYPNAPTPQARPEAMVNRT